MPLRALLVILPFILMGCAHVNGALTPAVQVAKDEFDGAAIVRQPPVSAAYGMRDAWHTLGFEWIEKTPGVVYLTAAAQGAAISELAFNADGRIFGNLKVATLPVPANQGNSRRFVMVWDDFMVLVNAKEVKMRASRDNEYTVSSFGSAYPNAQVNATFVPFVAKVREVRAENGKTRKRQLSAK